MYFHGFVDKTVKQKVKKLLLWRIMRKKISFLILIL
jgi:hypothetical protein